MKRLYLILLLLTVTTLSFGSYQDPDVLLYKNDTFEFNIFDSKIYEFIRDSLLKDENDTNRIMEFIHLRETCQNVAGGYSKNSKAEWTIKDNKLYLIKLCCSYFDSTDFKVFFKGHLVNGNVLANWITDTIRIGKKPSHCWPFRCYYPEESLLYFKNGKLIKEEKFINPPMKYSPFENDSLEKYIYSKLDWKRIIPNDSINYLIKIKVSANEEEKIDSINYMTICSKHLKNDINTILETINEWDLCYYCEKFLRTTKFVRLEINENNKRKYWR